MKIHHFILVEIVTVFTDGYHDDGDQSDSLLHTARTDNNNNKQQQTINEDMLVCDL